MANKWLTHVRNFRKKNSHLSYKQLLSEAKHTYGGGVAGNESSSSLTRSATRVGGGVAGNESRSSLTRSATRVGGSNLGNLLKTSTNTLKNVGNAMKSKIGGKSRRRRR
jgi:hypothetical protein